MVTIVICKAHNKHFNGGRNYDGKLPVLKRLTYGAVTVEYVDVREITSGIRLGICDACSLLEAKEQEYGTKSCRV